jgi:hypothetical protein
MPPRPAHDVVVVHMIVVNFAVRASVVGFKQVPEQRAIVNHRLPEIFGARPALRVLQGDFPRRAIVHDNIRVIDRNIGDALLEFTHRITTRSHYLADETIGFRYGSMRIIDKTRLDTSPGAVETVRIGRAQRADLQLGHPLCARLESGLGLSMIPFRAKGAVVLRAEPLPQTLAAHPVHGDPYDGADQHNCEQHPYDW